MHTNDQHLLIVGSVEDADPTAFRQRPGGAPEKVVVQLRSARGFEAEYLALWGLKPDITCRRHPSQRRHGLNDQQHRVAVGREVKTLQRAQLLHLFLQEFGVLLL